MSFIAGYLTGLASSQGGSLYDMVLSLPVLASFWVTDSYILTMRYDSEGLFINAPAAEAGGVYAGGEPLAYITQEYLSRPVMWLCLSKNTLSDIVLIHYAGYSTYEGWGHSREYRYDRNTGVYLAAECIQQTVPSVTFAYQPDQRYNIGTLSMQWIYDWTYLKTSYTAGGESTEETLSGRIATIRNVPNVLLNNMSILPAGTVMSRLYEFAAECEERREELISISAAGRMLNEQKI